MDKTEIFLFPSYGTLIHHRLYSPRYFPFERKMGWFIVNVTYFEYEIQNSLVKINVRRHIFHFLSEICLFSGNKFHMRHDELVNEIADQSWQQLKIIFQ